MNTEEKAKRYDEALERAKKWYNPTDADLYTCVAESIFPELKEPKNKRIREALIYHYQGDGCLCTNEYRIDYKDIRSWLEKQGEHTDKVEPKFHEGDWVVFNNHHDSVYQIEKIENYEYTLRYFLGGSMSLPFSHENMIRAWTLDDAEDGDILATSAGVFIYNGNNGGGSCPGSYCGINTLGRFQTGAETHWTGKPVFPATKSQRDTLFAKMKEAGYELSEKTHELKKIEQKPQRIISAEAKEALYDKPAWSEEDMKESLRTEYEKGRADTIAEMKKDWSEEDEYNLQCITAKVVSDIQNGNVGRNNELIDWLKSLKQRIGE